jgi:hypothetical protein
VSAYTSAIPLPRVSFFMFYPRFLVSSVTPPGINPAGALSSTEDNDISRSPGM